MNRSPLILIVDDEELVREVASMMVQEAGWRAITAVDGRDCLNTFRKLNAAVDAVFMDFSMPDLNGYETYLELHRINPSVKVLFVSGLRLIPEVEALIRSGQAACLHKPFHEAELLKLLHQMIGEHRAEG